MTTRCPRTPAPTRCSTRSTPSSARSPPPCTARCACWPAPAPARPGRSPTASPTACAPGVYQPAAGAGRHLHRPRRRRDARPAARARRRRACRRAPSTPPRCASCSTSGRRRVGGDAARAGRRTRPAGRRGRRAGCRLRLDRAARARPRRRDRVGQGHPDSSPTTTPPRRPPSRPRAPGRPRPDGRWPRLYAAYEEVKRDRGVIDFEDVLLLTVGMLDEHRATSPSRCAASTGTSSSTSTRTSARSSSGCSSCGSASRDDLCVVGDASQTIYSFTGASPELPARLPRRGTPAPAVVELVRDYRSTPQVVGLANRVAARRPAGRRRAGCELVAQRPAGPEPELRRATPTSRPRPPPSPPAIAAPDRRGHARQRDRRAVPHQRPVRGLRAGAGRRRHALPACAAASGSSTAPEVREAVVLLRGAARVRRRLATPLRPTVARDVLLGGGLDAAAARRRRRGPRALGVAGRAGRARRGPRRRRPRGATLARPRAPSSTSAPPPSTPRPSRASRSPRCTRPRAWSGTPSSWSALAEGMLPITVRRDRRGGRGGAPAALRRRHPGPRAAGPVLGRARARPGGRATRRPSRFLDGTAAVLGEAARSQPKRRKGAAGAGGRSASPQRTTCRTCGADLGTAKERNSGAARPARPRWTSGSSSGCASGGSRPARAAGVPAFVVFTDATLTAIAERVPADVGALARINGVGPAKLERYGADVLDLLKNFSDAE